MRTKQLAIGIMAVIAICGGAIFYIESVKPIFLVAKHAVPVFATADESMVSPPPKAVAQLAPQQHVPVLRCVDVKHYQVYEVRLPDGTTGYVNAGEYDLLAKDGTRSSC